VIDGEVVAAGGRNVPRSSGSSDELSVDVRAARCARSTSFFFFLSGGRGRRTRVESDRELSRRRRRVRRGPRPDENDVVRKEGGIGSALSGGISGGGPSRRIVELQCYDRGIIYCFLRPLLLGEQAASAAAENQAWANTICDALPVVLLR